MKQLTALAVWEAISSAFLYKEDIDLVRAREAKKSNSLATSLALAKRTYYSLNGATLKQNKLKKQPILADLTASINFFKPF